MMMMIHSVFISDFQLIKSDVLPETVFLITGISFVSEPHSLQANVVDVWIWFNWFPNPSLIAPKPEVVV